MKIFNQKTGIDKKGHPATNGRKRLDLLQVHEAFVLTNEKGLFEGKKFDFIAIDQKGNLSVLTKNEFNKGKWVFRPVIIEVTPGHSYILPNFEQPQEDGQVLHFIHKEKEGEEFITINDGTTNEAVLQMLILRLSFLYKKLPDEATSDAIGHVKQALSCLVNRTKVRKIQKVEGTPKPHKEQVKRIKKSKK